LAFLYAKKEITPSVDACIFADTGGEPASVYSYLDFLEKELPFPVHRVMHKDGLTKNIDRAFGEGETLYSLPFHTDLDGSEGILGRQCTRQFKLVPIKRKLRELLGYKKGQRIPAGACVQSIGISLDEIQRMKESKDKWIENVFPLVDLRMRRGDCFEWLKKNGFPEPPRSACVYCPYHSDHEWRKVKKDPAAWAESVRIDRLIRDGTKHHTSKLFLHPSLKPLEDVDLSTDIDRGQMTLFNSGVSGLECEGMCGV
jgi:3'-phosphoadenosine 5'-phosphosulfate sulfotransferase (PAPS reductase)/FAD synthetase